MATDLYPLPPSLKPYEAVDSSNIRYLNHSHSFIVNPLSKILNIEVYNDNWFDELLRTSQPLFDYYHPTLAFPDDQLTPFNSLSDLHTDTNTIPPSPLIDKSDTDILSPPSPLVLSKALSSSDGLFSIRYTPENTFKQRWFLVQVNHVETTILKIYILILQGIITSHFWRNILMISICAMIEHDGGLNGTNIRYMTTMFQSMELACYFHQNVNQILRNLCYGRIM